MSDEKPIAKVPEVVLNSRGKPRKSDWGRPKVTFSETDIKYIYRMCKQGLPLVVIAGIVGCSLRTLQRRLSEDPELFDMVNKGKSEAYIELYEKAVELAKQGNERFLLYLLEKLQSELEFAQNQGTLDVTNVKNDIQNVSKERLLKALRTDKFLELGSEDATNERNAVDQDKSQ